MIAELAYLFRHALLRDAAYQLQLPSDRARLHGLAFELIESAFGGRAPEPPPLDGPGLAKIRPQPTDTVAAELADHAKLAEPGPRGPEMRKLRTRYLRYAAGHFARVFRADAAIAAWRELAGLLDGGARGEALRLEAQVRLNMADLRGAERSLLDSVEVLRQAGSPRLEGIALADLATVQLLNGRKDEAEKTFGIALECLRGDEFAEARVKAHLAGLYRETGRVDLSEKTHRSAIETFRRLGERTLEGTSLGNLATLFAETGRSEQGKQLHEEALELHRSSGDRRLEGATLMNMSVQALAEGDVKGAERLVEESIRIARQVGDRRLEAYSLYNHACVCDKAERPGAGDLCRMQALGLLRDMGDRRAEGVVLAAQASRHHLAGRKEEARPMYAAAKCIFEEMGDRRHQAINGCNMALLEIPDGNLEKAAADWSAALAMLREAGDVDEVARQVESMKRACGKAGVAAFKS